MRILISVSVIALVLWGCNSGKPSDLFSTNLAGHVIHFPISAGELDTTKYRLTYVLGSKYVDSSETVKVEWLFDTREKGKDPAMGISDKRQAYGVNIYLKNKGSQIDSVKKALEKHFGKPMVPVEIAEIKEENFDRNLGFTCQLNPHTNLFLRKASSGQGDTWSQFNSLRIGIGYNLKKDQLERFASFDSKIHKSYD
jgi:uncharacterized protein YcgL (UPF0745 family)